MNKLILPALLLFFASTAFAANSLLFFEIQTIAGYSSMQESAVYHSGHDGDPMQKNSVGFDFIKKFSSQTRDILTAALQLRLAYDDNEEKAQLQVYNAYLKAKFNFGDIWAGHNRAAFGLESYWDTHGDLLQPLPMYNFGFDRDWGVGFSKDTRNGNISFAFASGSAMALKFYGNWIFTSRISKGVLSYDNYNAGLSFMGGRILETMGYTVTDKNPKDIILAGADFAYNHDNIEHKAQINAGQKNKETALAGLYRLTLNFLDENRLKIEGQAVYAEQEKTSDYFISAAASYKITPDLTARILYEREHEMDDKKTILQLYYYFRI